MAVISFSEQSPKSAWVVAGWAFRQLLADALATHKDEREIASTLERAEAVGFLRLGHLEKRLAMRLAALLTNTATGILAGRIRSGIGDRFKDEQTQQEYLKGLRMLLDASNSAELPFSPSTNTN